MTTTTTRYKKGGGKKGKQTRKKISADLQDLRYKINYTTYNTTENDPTYTTLRTLVFL